ncbi:ABC transporter ATP-binding protein/permease [Paenibacillus sp. alder61]|uniref:ABC transporter ATP-binding protein n=1 Tax=Paenibacillus TaxID=44249 RepID=UPI001BD10677|nr:MULTISPECIES: ABC transporter ATP-binding protein [Paenibacillus]MCA1292152.1 ABC transporter ATP-binding protein/permease [Paenibacillus sp. alder61]
MKALHGKLVTLQEYMKMLAKTFDLLWKSSKHTLVLLLFFNLLAGLSLPISTIIWKFFIDSVVEAFVSKDLSKPILWILIHLLYTQFNDIMHNLCRYFESNQVDYMNKHITELTLDKIERMEMADFDNAEIYDCIQKVNSESTQHSMNLLRTLILALQNFSSMSGAIVIFLNFGPLILLISFFACLPSLVINIKMSSKLFDIFTKRFERLRFINYLKSIVITYENIKEVKVNRLNSYFKTMIINDFNIFLSEDKKIRKRFTLQNSMASLLENIVSYSFQIYILVKVVSRNLTLGDLTLFISTLSNFQNSIQNILNSVSSLYDDALYIQNLFLLLEREIPNQEAASTPYPAGFEKIEFQNVYFKYPGREEFVLNNISFILLAKKSYSFVGLNGSGKTTLVKLLLRLYKPTSGHILMDGININNIDLEQYYKHIGVVFQDFIKYPFDIEKNIALGSIEDLNNFPKVKKAAEQSGADRFIEELPLKYATMLNKEWSEATQLSLGQWQRLAISRAFMSDSSILILDEPTASLDAEAEFELFTKFKDLMFEKTTILITHRLSTIRLVDEILVLKDGQVLESGNHETLLRYNGEYARLYKMQSDMYMKGELVNEGSH